MLGIFKLIILKPLHIKLNLFYFDMQNENE